MAAPYRVDLRLTDDESFFFSFECKMDDGSDFPWGDYTYGYDLGQCGSITFNYSLGSGATIDEALNLITFAAPSDYRLARGVYDHGFRITSISSGQTIQIFDGSVTVTEGNFTHA